jgi:anti-anti-sigma regulatory factor
MSDRRMIDARAAAAQLQLHTTDDEAWIVAVGKLDGTRARALSAIVDELVFAHAMHPVSVDISWAVATDRVALDEIAALCARAGAGVDVTTAGSIQRYLHRPRAA